MPKPTGISGSRGASILGLSNWSTPVQAWLEIMEGRYPGFCEKNGYVKPEREYNIAMRFGHLFEDSICEKIEDLDHNITDRETPFVLSETYDYITCHPDGVIDGGALLENKTTDVYNYREKWGEPGTDRIPQEYQIQVQHNMMTLGLKYAVVYVLIFPRRVAEFEHLVVDDKFIYDEYEWVTFLDQMGFFKKYYIEANYELQEKMLEMYVDFWENNVLKQIPPTPKNYNDIKLLCPAPVGTIIADENVMRLMAEYKLITKELGSGGQYQKRKKQIKNDVMKFLYENGGKAVEDSDSVEKIILRDEAGKKLASFDGKVFR